MMEIVKKLQIVFIYKLTIAMLGNQNQISSGEIKQAKAERTDKVLVQKEQNKENNIPAIVLKQSITNQQRDRVISKLQKEIQAKDDQLYQLTKNFRQIQQQSSKSQINITKLVSQNDSFKLKVKQLIKENQKLKQAASKKDDQTQNMQLKKFQTQNTQHQKRAFQLQKQHKINIRRILAQKEQIQKSLESKVQVKSKQLQKIEELFEKKKQEFNLVLQQKDSQLKTLSLLIVVKQNNTKELSQSLENTQKKFRSLEQKLSKLESQYENQSKLWIQNSQESESRLKQASLKNKELLQSLKDHLISLNKDCSYDQTKLQLCQIIQNTKKWMQGQLQTKNSQIARLVKQNQEIEKLKKIEIQLNDRLNIQKIQLQKLSSTYLESKSRAQILEQQVKFMRGKQKNTTDFAEIIRQHLKETKSKLKIDQNSLERKQTECKIKYKVDFKTSTASEKQELGKVKTKIRSGVRIDQSNLRVQEANNMGRNKFQHQKDTHYNLGVDKSSCSILYNRSQTLKGDLSEQIVKNCSEYQTALSQLTHKKQSLIYLMYQGQNTNLNKPSSQRSHKIQPSKTMKKRSNSLSELVRLRCESNTLDVNDCL